MRPERLGRICTLFLEQATGAEAEIREAYFTQDGRIELSDVRIWVPGRDDEGGKLLDVEEVVIDPSIISILSGSFKVESIRLLKPTVYVTEDIDQQLMNYQLLAKAEKPDDESKQTFPRSVPSLSIRDAKVKIGEYSEGQYTLQDEVDLEGRITRVKDKLGGYYFQLREMAGPEVKAPMFEGEFNLKDQSFFVNLEGFEFANRQRLYLPLQVRNWWSRLGLKGDVPVMKIGYTPKTGIQADIELAGGELSVPFDEFPVNLTDVDLRLQIANERIDILRLTGRMQAGETTRIQYSITGNVYGLEAGSPFELKLNTDEFVVTDDTQFILGLPSELQKQYDLLKPQGLFKAHATITRKKANEKIAYNGNVELIDVSGEYRKFKLPLKHGKGIVSFERDLITLKEVKATGVHGGDVTISGTIRNPGPAAESRLTIGVTDMPIDESLLNALEPKHRKIADQFLDKKAVYRFHNAKLIRLNANEEGDAPVFVPGGDLDMHINLYRPGIVGAKPQVTTDLDLRGGRIMYKHFAYPVVATSGHAVISPEGTTLKDVKLVGLSGGEFVLNGGIKKLPNHEAKVDISVDRYDMPSDEYLTTAVPEPQNDWLKKLSLDGDITGKGRVNFTLPNKPDFTFTANFKGMSLDPFNSGYVINQMGGEASIHPTGISLDHVTGWRNSGEIDVNGDVDWSVKPMQMSFDLKAKNIAIEDEVLNLFPEDDPDRDTLAKLFDEYKPNGKTDVNIRLNNKNETRNVNLDIDLEPKEFSFTYHKHRFNLNALSGMIHVKEDKIELDRIAGSFRNGEFELSGIKEFGDFKNTALNFKVKSATLGLSSRAILPEKVVELVDDISINGRYEINDGRLIIRDDNTNSPKYELDSTIQMTGGSAKLGVPIANFEGDIKLKVVGHRNAKWPWMDIRIDAERFTAMDRLVQPFKMVLASGKANNQLELKDFEGDIYGGKLIGDGEILLGEDGDYEFDLKIHDANVEAFMDPVKYNSQLIAHDESDDNGLYLPPPKYQDGTISASLLIAQTINDPTTRRGRGMIQVRNAHLYNQPFGLALLQAASLTLPTASSFDHADARYVIDGDRVYVDSLAITSPGFEMSGGGLVKMPDMDLDITMYTKNPNAIDIGPLGEIIDLVKNEFIAVQVGGTLSDPQASIAPFTGFRNSFNEIFGQRQARRQWDDMQKTKSQ
ncbi:hypothetical protein JD969_04115 [Planctomycetota bacterium]|nr:hypothetical protein JD969_04115 [Planctomycetota bacterium]